MDLSITGKFIAEMRKEKKLTQVQLAEKLYVSEKTISKWECGKGFPDTTLMLPLCEALGISANELLTGKKIDSSEEYKEKAEDNLLKLMAERKASKKIVIVQVIIMVMALLSAITIFLLAEPYESTNPLLFALLLIIGFVVIALEYNFGSFECKHCGYRFMPSVFDFVMGPHSITTRHLKCPKCGKSSFCKRKLTKNK
ncbi:MAG: helix-turn-helix transcriptional regulator [Clostridia bacterium]|nr:helix-turn-helix transcriptional regulator [Clostridia bacterium]